GPILPQAPEFDRFLRPLSHWTAPRRLHDDRGREGRLGSTPPSLRTGRADLPHPALRSMVLPARGLASLGMGVLQAEKPMLRKEGVGPAEIVEGARDSHWPRCLRRILRRRRRIQPSSGANVE